MARETREERQKRLENERVLRQRQQKEQRQQSYIFGALLNTTTYMVIFLLLIFGLSAEAYQREPQRYSWLDENGEFKTSTYDVTISYNLDTPLDDLNGYSLKDVFEDEDLIVNGDFTNDYTGWTCSVTLCQVNNGILEFTSNNNYANVRQTNIDLPAINDKYYIRADMKASSTGALMRVYIGSQVKHYNYFGNGDWYPVGDVVTSDNNTTYLQLRFYEYISSGWQTIYIDNVIALNLTDLGIDQTKDEMDYWYSEYQRLQQNRINDMKNLGQYAVSSWTTTTEILKSIGQALNSVYETMPVSWLLDWILDISL
jgi:hypothetical protein